MADPSETAARFPARLRELREAAGVSRGVLADKAGVNPRTLEAYEQGRNQPTWEAVLRLADALGTTVAAFAVQPAAR